jgi:hypothetical protein
LVNGKNGQLEVDDVDDGARRWTIIAHRLLGLPTDGRYRNHVGNMIWRNRAIVKALQERIECNCGMTGCARADPEFFRVHGLWRLRVYGVFVREIVGYDEAGHAPSTVLLVKPSWDFSLSTDSAIETFFRCCDPFSRRDRCPGTRKIWYKQKREATQEVAYAMRSLIENPCKSL